MTKFAGRMKGRRGGPLVRKRPKTKERRSVVRTYAEAWARYACTGGRPPDPPSSMSGLSSGRIRRMVVRALTESGWIRNYSGRGPLFHR